MRKLVIYFSLIFFLAGASPAQPTHTTNSQITASLASSSISMSDTTTLSISITADSADLQVPVPHTRDGGLQITPRGSSVSSTMMNGQVTTSAEYSYQITPLREGRHLIEPVSGTIGGIPFTTQSLRLEVVKSSGASATPRTRTRPRRSIWSPPVMVDPWTQTNPGGFPPSDPFSIEPREDDVLLEMQVEPKTVYAHQPIFYTLKLLSAVSLLSDPRYNPIAPTGFLQVPFPQKNEQEVRHDRSYSVSSVTTAYFPLTEGDYSFDPTRVRINSGALGLPKMLVTDSARITVLPLPAEGRPDSFTGAVGEHFEIQAQLKDRSISLGDTTKLTVTVSGNGHLSLVPYPYLPHWAGLEKKQTASPTTTTTKNDEIASTRSYNFTIKPTQRGDYKLPGITLAYFNPQQKSYQTIKAPELSLKVTANPNSSTDPTSPISLLGQDKLDLPLSQSGPSAGALPKLPDQALALSGLLLLAGSGLMLLPKLGSKLRKSPHSTLDLQKNHVTVDQLLADLEKLAPGPDSDTRRLELKTKGWSQELISRLEALRQKATSMAFGADKNGSLALKDLDLELASILKEVKK